MKKTIIIFLTFIFLIIGNTVFASNYMQSYPKSSYRQPYSQRNNIKINYIRLYGGQTFARDGKIKLSTPHNYNSNSDEITLADFTTEKGYLISGALGRKINFLRGEFEILFQKYQTKKLINFHEKLIEEFENQTGERITSLSLSESSSMITWGFMLNGYLDLNNNTPITPFAMLGLGLSYNKTKLLYQDLTIEKKDWTGIAWQIGGGISCTIDERLALDLSYKYFGTIPIKSLFPEEKTKQEIIFNPGKTHNVLLGLRYNLL